MISEIVVPFQGSFSGSVGQGTSARRVGSTRTGQRMSTKPHNQDSGPLELWTVEETAAFLRVPVATLHKWRYLGKGPRGHRVGKYVRFDAAEVRRWVLSS